MWLSVSRSICIQTNLNWDSPLELYPLVFLQVIYEYPNIFRLFWTTCALSDQPPTSIYPNKIPWIGRTQRLFMRLTHITLWTAERINSCAGRWLRRQSGISISLEYVLRGFALLLIGLYRILWPMSSFLRSLGDLNNNLVYGHQLSVLWPPSIAEVIIIITRVSHSTHKGSIVLRSNWDNSAAHKLSSQEDLGSLRLWWPSGKFQP